MSELQQIINNLKTKPEVDAVFIAGSQGQGKQKSYSDIDLVVVLNENTKGLHSLFQWIDKKPGDVYFFDHADINKLLSVEEIPSNKMDAVLVDWVAENNLEFDKSGLLTKLKESTAIIRTKLTVPISEKESFEDKINHAYITNKRYFDSANDVYHEALKIKLLQDLYTVIIGYFEFKNIPWRGEKAAIAYFKDNDLEFYDCLFKCINETDVSKKFDVYAALTKKVLSFQRCVWNVDTIKPFAKQSAAMSEADLTDYWKRLIA